MNENEKLTYNLVRTLGLLEVLSVLKGVSHANSNAFYLHRMLFHFHEGRIRVPQVDTATQGDIDE